VRPSGTVHHVLVGLLRSPSTYLVGTPAQSRGLARGGEWSSGGPMDKANRASEIRAKASQLLARAVKLEGQSRDADRKSRTRRAVLVGLMILNQLEADHPVPSMGTWEDLRKAMDSFLRWNRDRAMFDLPLKEEPPT